MNTCVFDLCKYAISSSCLIAFNEYEEKYTTFKELVFASRKKSLKKKGKEKRITRLHVKTFLEEKVKGKETNTSSSEKYLDTSPT